MKVVMTLGVRFGASKPPVVFTVVDMPSELNYDDVFEAANRIDLPAMDKANLKYAWQRRIRDLIDIYGSPSMSVHDELLLMSDAGQIVMKVICESHGWSFHPIPDEVGLV